MIINALRDMPAYNRDPKGYLASVTQALNQREHDEFMERMTRLWVIPALCSPWGRLMP